MLKIFEFISTNFNKLIPMADKEKRLRKILVRRGLKGKLKPVNTLEEAHIILVEDKPSNKFVGVSTYRQWIEEGHTFPEDKVHYLVSSNPRNAWDIDQRFIANSGRAQNKII